MQPCGELERVACGACSVGVLGERMHAAMQGVGTCGMRGMQCGNQGVFFQVTLINDMKIIFSELSYLIMLFAFLNSLSVRGF
jgi:hypothetical protein